MEGKAVIGKRLVQLIFAIAFGIEGMGLAAAQVYPSRPITIIVPYPAGGNTDIMGRALQVELSKSLGQTIIINNKGGASGTIGIRDLVKAEPDGYTVALTPNNPLTAQPHLQKLNYSIDSFRYVCLTYHTPYVLIAGPQAPFKTFAEFVKFAKAKPENLVYGTAGMATTPHLAMLAVLKAIGADGLAVPFQGEGPQSHALLSGTVMAIASTPAVAAAGNLPVLAALSDERIATLPDVPTVRELGFPAEAFTAGGLIAPAENSRRRGCRLGKGVCPGGLRRRVPDHRRTPQRDAALPARRGLPEVVRERLDPECGRHPARRPGHRPLTLQGLDRATPSVDHGAMAGV